MSHNRERAIGATGGGVATPVDRDAKRVLGFLSEAEELAGDDPFRPPFLEQLEELIGAEWTGYEERDFVSPRCLVQHDYPEVAADNEFDPDAARSFQEDPLRLYYLGGRFNAISLSHLLPRRELERTHFHELVLAPLGITDSLAVAIPSPASHSKRFLFDRHGGHFSKRDRTVLDYLQPHFGRLWRAAQTRRRLCAAISGLELAAAQDTRGVILLAPDGHIDFASPPGRRLMREYFGPLHGTELPLALAEWLKSGAPTLRVRLNDRHLTVGRSGDALLLEEARDELGITPRQREILEWVARGKTNSEIAEALWITPTTVRKHLENIYAKLGVHRRTAAVTRLLGITDDEIRRESASA
jgi:DNA-binding CsgD family transcriptional regulator